MALKQVGILFSAAVLATLVSSVTAQDAAARSKKHTVSGRGHNYFVPPPPPYAPSLLPERMMRPAASDNAVEEVAEQKAPENPYSKYIFTRQASDMPRVVQPNRYVSYWHKT